MGHSVHRRNRRSQNHRLRRRRMHREPPHHIGNTKTAGTAGVITVAYTACVNQRVAIWDTGTISTARPSPSHTPHASTSASPLGMLKTISSWNRRLLHTPHSSQAASPLGTPGTVGAGGAIAIVYAAFIQDGRAIGDAGTGVLRCNLKRVSGCTSHQSRYDEEQTKSAGIILLAPICR